MLRIYLNAVFQIISYLSGKHVFLNCEKKAEETRLTANSEIIWNQDFERTVGFLCLILVEPFYTTES